MKVKLSSTPRYAPSELPDSPVAISELGFAYYVLNTVARVEPGSPAAKAGMQAGDRIMTAKIIPPSAEQLAELRKKYHDDDLGQGEVTLHFADDERNWACFLLIVQSRTAGHDGRVYLAARRQKMTAKVAPAPAKDWFDSQRGWILEPMTFVQKAGSFSEALRWGAQETANATLLVYRTLHSVVGTKQISVRNFSGPLGILGSP